MLWEHKLQVNVSTAFFQLTYCSQVNNPVTIVRAVKKAIKGGCNE